MVTNAPKLLEQIQNDMLEVSKSRNKKMITEIKTIDDLDNHLKAGKIGFARLPYKETQNPKFDDLMDQYKISRRCLDDNDPEYVFVAKSY